MKIQKWSIYITIFFCIISLSIVLKLELKTNAGQGLENFWRNIMYGIFGSSFLSLFLSVIGYLNERKNNLENFYKYSKKILKALKEGKEIDFDIYDDYYGKFDFIFPKANKKIREDYIYSKIYLPVWKLKCLSIAGENLKHHPQIYHILKELDGKYYEIIYGKKVKWKSDCRSVLAEISNDNQMLQRFKGILDLEFLIPNISAIITKDKLFWKTEASSNGWLYQSNIFIGKSRIVSESGVIIICGNAKKMKNAIYKFIDHYRINSWC